MSYPGIPPQMFTFLQQNFHANLVQQFSEFKAETKTSIHKTLRKETSTYIEKKLKPFLDNLFNVTVDKLIEKQYEKLYKQLLADNERMLAYIHQQSFRRNSHGQTQMAPLRNNSSQPFTNEGQLNFPQHRPVNPGLGSTARPMFPSNIPVLQNNNLRHPNPEFQLSSNVQPTKQYICKLCYISNYYREAILFHLGAFHSILVNQELYVSESPLKAQQQSQRNPLPLPPLPPPPPPYSQANPLFSHQIPPVQMINSPPCQQRTLPSQQQSQIAKALLNYSTIHPLVSSAQTERARQSEMFSRSFANLPSFESPQQPVNVRQSKHAIQQEEVNLAFHQQHPFNQSTQTKALHPLHYSPNSRPSVPQRPPFQTNQPFVNVPPSETELNIDRWANLSQNSIISRSTLQTHCSTLSTQEEYPQAQARYSPISPPTILSPFRPKSQQLSTNSSVLQISQNNLPNSSQLSTIAQTSQSNTVFSTVTRGSIISSAPSTLAAQQSIPIQLDTPESLSVNKLIGDSATSAITESVTPVDEFQEEDVKPDVAFSPILAQSSIPKPTELFVKTEMIEEISETQKIDCATQLDFQMNVSESTSFCKKEPTADSIECSFQNAPNSNDSSISPVSCQCSNIYQCAECSERHLQFDDEDIQLVDFFHQGMDNPEVDTVQMNPNEDENDDALLSVAMEEMASKSTETQPTEPVIDLASELHLQIETNKVPNVTQSSGQLDVEGMENLECLAASQSQNDLSAPNKVPSSFPKSPKRIKRKHSSIGTCLPDLVVVNMKCARCDEIFTKDDYGKNVINALQDHHWEAHRILSQQCLICSESFHTRSDLTRHCLNRHTVGSGTIWICAHCGSIQSNYRDLETHNREHHALGLYECSVDECQFSANNRNAVKIHLENEHLPSLKKHSK